ncbi:MAG: hypothetical protein HY810_03620 [Candidatus Omnitrophica bacterium]|nr:hypothetical protein [Candidatus Omnitrophota bacterium]
MKEFTTETQKTGDAELPALPAGRCVLYGEDFIPKFGFIWLWKKEAVMKKVAKLMLVVAGISFISGLVSRVTVMPIPPGVYGLEANAFLRFTDTCLLAAIALMLFAGKDK